MPALEKTVDAAYTVDDLSFDTPDHTHDNLERKLVRKLDLRMSIIMVIYTLNLIDRANVTNARLQGFEQDLHLHGEEYAVVVSILFVGYISMQVPANMFLYWLQRPSLLIPGCMIAWGVISALTGVTTNYTGALVARFFLGFAEAPFYPGVLFLISGWYKRDELALRTALVSCGIPISGAFGSLMASGVLEGMQGVLGQAAWRWLFYIEGGITVFIAICAIFILPDFPHNTKWLTPEERALAISRLAEDGQGRDAPGKKTSIQGLREAASDWKVWWFATAFIIQVTGQSFTIYFPTLSATMGYGTTVSLLLCTPPWVFSTIVVFAVSRYSDKKQRRYRYYVASNALTALGFIISLSTMNTAARYISLFITAQVYAGHMVLWGWIHSTFAGEPSKRAVAVAMINAMANIGNLIGSYIWPSNWGPTYRYSYAICLALLCLSTSMFGCMYLHLRRLNEEMDRMELSAKGEEGSPVPIRLRYLL